LLLFGALAVTHDLRAGMIGNIAVMAIAAWMLLRTIAATRGGRLRYTDAFIPIALLHIGNWENYMWTWQLGFVLSAALVLAVLVAVSATDLWTSRGRAVLAAAAIAALPLCGANGMAFAAPMGAWLALEALTQLRGDRIRTQTASIVLTGVSLGAVASAYYFVGYTHATWNPPSPSVGATIKTAIKFLALGFGPVVANAADIWGIVLLALMAPPVILVSARALRDGERDERLRAARLLAYAGAMGVLALAFGWGRAGLVPTVGLPDRYVLLAVPAVTWIYVATGIYAGGATRRVIHGAMLVIACVLLPFNTRDGFEWRDWYRDGMQAVISDIDAGMSREALVARHRKLLMAWSPDRLAAGMTLLRDARVGPFGRLTPERQAPGRSQPERHGSAAHPRVQSAR
jgi:hypothetical protein